MVKVTVTEALALAVPLMVSVSAPLMMSSVAMLGLITKAVGGAKLLSMVMLRATGLEVTPPTVWLTLTDTLPAPKVATSAVVKEAVLQLVPLTVAALVMRPPVLKLVSTTRRRSSASR